MQTTLIYNPQAGIGPHPKPDEILAALKQAGHEPVYHPTSTESDLDYALAEASDLVVVAGGDGSIRAVATRTLGKGVKITPLPMGTANNIARLLPLPRDPFEIIAGLSDPVEYQWDLGRVKSSQSTEYFLEAMGVGMFADMMRRYRPEIGKSIPRGIKTILNTLKDYQPKYIHVVLDGEDLSGSYVLLEVMNTPTVGLRFRLAPDAEPDDGQFDVVLIHANQRENYLDYMAGVLLGKLEDLPAVSVMRGRHLEIAWRGFPLHMDAEVRAGLDWIEENVSDQELDKSNLLDIAGPFLRVELESQAVHFLLPRPHSEQMSQ